MSKSKWIEDHFRKRLEDERNRKGLTQTDLADMLKLKGIHMHWTTIAKIEKGTRSVRIDEAAAFADCFGISVDTLLGRRARPKSDRVHVLTAVADTAIRSAGPIIDTAMAVRDRIADLSAFDDLPGRDTLIADCERAYDHLVAANDALTDTARVARHNIHNEVKPK
jgi:transcriptional regulator with XRE-family HTH domain